MASQGIVENLQNIVENIKSLNDKQVLRPDYGEFSLQRRKPGYFDRIKSRCDYYLKYAPSVSGDYVERVTNILDAIYSALVHLNNADRNEYANIIDDHIQTLEVQEEEFNKYRAYFMVEHIIESQVLEDDAIAQRKALMESVLTDLDRRIEMAQEEGKKADHKMAIVTGKATEGSFKKAIDQFKEAQDYLDRKCLWWLLACAGSVALLAGILAWFLFADVSELGNNRGMAIYYTAIRIAVLSVFGGLSGFCLRVYLSQLHMSRHNYHKQCIANIMDSFVHAAVDPEQKDKILSILVEAVAKFGSSGLIRDRDDHMTSSRMAIDQITRTVAPGRTDV